MKLKCRVAVDVNSISGLVRVRFFAGEKRAFAAAMSCRLSLVNHSRSHIKLHLVTIRHRTPPRIVSAWKLVFYFVDLATSTTTCAPLVLQIAPDHREYISFYTGNKNKNRDNLLAQQYGVRSNLHLS